MRGKFFLELFYEIIVAGFGSVFHIIDTVFSFISQQN
jgi:hypothetical protein